MQQAVCRLLKCQQHMTVRLSMQECSLGAQAARAGVPTAREHASGEMRGYLITLTSSYGRWDVSVGFQRLYMQHARRTRVLAHCMYS